MTKLNILQLFSQVRSPLLQGTVINILFLKLLGSVYANNVFINSCEQCVTSKEYTVTPELGYSVNVDPNANQSCHWQCLVNFRSIRNNSWLCLAQLGMSSQISDNNGELSVYDRSNKNHAFVQLFYFPSNMPIRETCRKMQFMDFSLKKVNQKANLDFKKLHIDFQVLDIESKDRVVYLDGTYCGTEYKLLNSQVTIYNQPEEDRPVTSSKTLISLCGIPIEMVEVDETTDKRICFLYKPSDHVDSSNWTFSVSVAGYSINPVHMIYMLNSSQEKSKLHGWCADKGIHKITVIFQRDTNVMKSAEHPKMFQFIVLDYNGTAESLMAEKAKIFKELQNISPDKSLSSSTIIIIILVSVAAALFVGLSVFLCSKGCGLSYQPVRNSKNATDV